MVVRTEVDAVNPDPNVPDTTPILPTTTALGFEGTTLQCLASDNAIPQQSRVAELKCFYDRNPWEARDTLQCVLGRVPTGYCARHLSSRMGENFMADIQRIDEHHFSAMDFIDPVIGSQLRNFFGAIRKVMAKRGVSKTVLIGDLKAGIQLHPMGRDRRAALPGSLVARMLETPSKPEDKKNGKATEVDVSTDKTNKVPCSGTPKPQQTKVANEPVTSSGGKSNSRTPSKRKAEGEADEEAPESKKAKTGDDDDDKIEEKQCTRTVKMTRFKNNREVHEWEERGKKEVWRK
ncbi:hypothetical protein SAICODRAFT_20001 [Saitoella complicata NRRL Y-17804]|nr:uncharacterized protein SAICODRAFT_20001 [Saitoella complicata NRRL Y-17804]ODQ52040.1 hypothetical protein SAICODRAFT_20001 [Saitoella complicata NRRL Y-17804]